MDRSSKAVISQVLADSVTPLLKRHGFDRRGRTYDRARDGRRELIDVQPNKWNNRYGGSFTMNLGIFIPEVDSIVSLYPLQAPPQESKCHIRCRIGSVGPDGRIRDDEGADAWRGWWGFDAATDLSAFGAEVRQWVEHNALGFFDNVSTGAGILAWLRRYPVPPDWVGLREVVLAAYAGGPTLAQECLDVVVATASPWPNRILREAARIAGRLGLACPAPTDTPALTVVFRVAADTTPQDRYGAFYHLEYKLSQHVELLRTVLSVQDPAALYHTAECTGHACTVTFYGADVDQAGRRENRGVASRSRWGLTPRQSIEAECGRRGRRAVIAGCAQLLMGADADPALIMALGGPAARGVLDCGPDSDQRYWLRVWGARGLLWVWDDSGLEAVSRALGDPAWRVREMAAKVVARHLVGDLLTAVAELRADPVPRVRAAATRAVAVLTHAGA